MRFGRRTSKAAFAAVALSVTWLGAGDAAAYCRTSVCNGNVASQVCTPPASGDCGTPLFWPKACFGFSLQEDASAQVDFATATAIVEQAFATWRAVDCGAGQGPAITVSNLGAISCDQQEYNQKSGNANIIVFREGQWPYAGQGNTLALTTVTYNLDNGEIFDADLEINASINIQLTTGDMGVQYDLLSIVTHEAGHMLGLAHTAETQATMTIEYVPGDVQLRTLHQDDMAGICAIYPPPGPATCDPTPRHGFQDVCGEIPEEEGCGCHTGPAPEGGRWWLAIGAVLALTSLRLRSARSRRCGGRP